MPITIAFTLTAAVAVALHVLYLRRLRGATRAYRISGRNGMGLAMGQMLLRIEAFRLAQTFMLLFAGAGVLVGFRPAAFLIAVIPLVGIVASSLDLRERW